MNRSKHRAESVVVAVGKDVTGLRQEPECWMGRELIQQGLKHAHEVEAQMYYMAGSRSTL